MTFIVNRKQLAEELALLQSVAETKATMPILAYVMFKLAGNILTLTATNLDVSITTEIEAEGEPWGGCVPSKQLYELARLLQGEQVEFEPKDNGRVQVKCGRSKHQLLTMPATEFPQIETPSGKRLSAQGEALRTAVTRVLPCITTEESRYVMGGIKFEFRDSELRLIATNGHRLGLASLPATGEMDDTLIPASGLSSLLKVKSETVEIQADENRALLKCGSRLIITQLMTGSFPNWELIVPKRQPHHAEMSRDDLVNALRLADITRAETYKTGTGRILAGVKITFSKELVTVETDESDRGQSEEPLAAISSLNGESVTIRINSEYVMDFLRYADKKVKCGLSDSAGVLCFTDGSCFQYVVAPMRL